MIIGRDDRGGSAIGEKRIEPNKTHAGWWPRNSDHEPAEALERLDMLESRLR